MTAVLLEPVTLAVNCWVCEADRLVLVGVTDTATGGFRLTVALADFVGSAALVAVTVTVCALAIEDGAVYRPVEVSVPTGELKVQVTAVSVEPVTLAVNCCACEVDKLTEAGEIPTATGVTSVTVALPDLV